MELRRVLRTLIVAEVAIMVLSIAVEIIAEQFLPEPLRAWLEREVESPTTVADVVLLLVALPLLAAIVVSWVGLWRLWRPARWIYLLAVVAALLLEAVAGPWIYSGPGAALSTAQSLISGMIVALVYFTPLSAAFQRPAAAPPGGFGVSMAGDQT